MAGVLAGGLWLSTPERPHPASVGHLGAAANGAGSIAVAGRGHAVDGDTLVIGGVRVRLEGIDAPETGQTCGGRELSGWACGTAALDALARLVAGQHVSCTGSGYDAYGRLLASCTAAGRELNPAAQRLGLGVRQVFAAVRRAGGRGEIAPGRHLARQRRAALELPRAALTDRSR